MLKQKGHYQKLFLLLNVNQLILYFPPVTEIWGTVQHYKSLLDIFTEVPHFFLRSILRNVVSSGSSDVPPYADEAGEPSYSK